jgi:hypothetical protein
LLPARYIDSNKSPALEVQSKVANESWRRIRVETSNRVSGIGIQHETSCRVTKIVTDVHLATVHNGCPAAASFAAAIVMPQLLTVCGVKSI